MPVAHVLYGLRIEANLPVPGLPVHSESDRIDVRIRLKEEAKPASVFSTPPGDFFYTSPNSGVNGETKLRVGMLAGGDYFGFFYSDGARFAVERLGREIWADWPENYTLEDACTYLIGPVIAFILRLRGVICLHASAIAAGGQAIALMGAPGAGKSTTAAAFARLGYPVLADDVAVLNYQGGRFLIQPGYPRVNLWPNSVRALFGAEDALPRITPTWGKCYLPLDQNGYRFQSQPLPLGAIYILGEREDGLAVAVVEELTGSEAFARLVANTYVNYLLDAEMRAQEFGVLGRVMTGVRVRRVRPPADPSKVSALCETIAADARQLQRHKSANVLPGVD